MSTCQDSGMEIPLNGSVPLLLCQFHREQGSRPSARGFHGQLAQVKNHPTHHLQVEIRSDAHIPEEWSHTF